MRFATLCLLVMFAFPPTAHAEMLADSIVVEKANRTLTLYNQDKVLKRYSITLGKSPEGPKMVEGDNKTPEGFYVISGRKENSEFHRALQISYPDELDVERARKMGLHAGGRIMIHGRPTDFGKRYRKRDWTHGCIAVTNEEIEGIWRLVPDGTPIEIRP